MKIVSNDFTEINKLLESYKTGKDIVIDISNGSIGVMIITERVDASVRKVSVLDPHQIKMNEYWISKLLDKKIAKEISQWAFNNEKNPSVLGGQRIVFDMENYPKYEDWKIVIDSE